ncbi:MAG: hypothetical protein ISS44_01040 [Candidatus Omnitrophica bacterium]|nr:hypothetical protein [Candidatus Omnitrophota bacterium]
MREIRYPVIPLSRYPVRQATGKQTNGQTIFYILYLIICFLFIGLNGCGYTTRSSITRLYRNIHVRPFVNKIDITSDTSVARRYKTYYPLLENDITRKVIDQFILDGDLRLVKEEEADLVLEGELVDYRRDALRYSGTDDRDIEEYRISLVVNLKFYDGRKKTLLWEIGSLIGDTTYLSQESESLAISDAVNDLARRVVDSLVDIW